MQLLNRVSLVGQIETEPRIFMDGKDREIMTFSLRTDPLESDQKGSVSHKYHQVAIEDALTACYARTYLHQGDLVLVEGKLDYSSGPSEAWVVVTSVQGLLHPLMVNQFSNSALEECRTG